MKKSLLLAIAALALVGCSRHSLVTDPSEANGKLVPVEFSVQRQNMTKATNLEAVKHYNFGVFAWKVNGSNSLADAEVMNNYLVGYSNGTDKGYDKTNATTYAEGAGTLKDHTSPWFYEGLGTAEYKYEGTDGFYKKTDDAYMSNNANQYLRYWDLAYANTNFYAYAPYNKSVTFAYDKTSHTGTLSFPATVIRDGYDNTLNPEYSKYDRSLSEFMYAGVQATNSDRQDVAVEFKHMDAQLNIRFYEEIVGYKVRIINLDGDTYKGIQAAPSVKDGDSYSKGSYYTTHGATVSYTATAIPTYTPEYSGATTAQTPLQFKVPEDVEFVPASVNNPTNQTYSYSSTVYYPVAQPANSKTGFTFHISYQVIAEDNNEVITVRNATVHVPYVSGSTKITVWQPNVKYTYTFKFTKNTTGTTDPAVTIDPTDPTASTTKSLYPIVFDNATIADYSTPENISEYTVSENTNY